MEVILLKDVEKVGTRGDVVRVRDGYARNFLLPRDLAMASTRSNRVFVEEQRVRAEKRAAKKKEAALKEAEKIGQLKVTLSAKAGEGDKLFGSVTTEDICKALEGEGYRFNKKQIHLKDPIRSLGSYSVKIDLYSEVKATFALDVVSAS